MKKESQAMEILRMARELVINEHTDKRAQMHNEWLAQSEYLWKTKKQKLAYPTIPPYPTEAEILVRAKTLIGFLKNDEDADDAKIQNEVQPETPLAKIVESQKDLPLISAPNQISSPKENEIADVIVVDVPKSEPETPSNLLIKNQVSPMVQSENASTFLPVEKSNDKTVEDFQEYGEWVPKLVTSSNGGAIQVKNNFSDYVKIGKIIYLNFDISIESLAAGSDSSFVLLDNLPYISRDGGTYCGSLIISYSEDMKVSVSSITGSVISGSYSCDMWIKKATELNLVRLQKGDLKNKTRLVGTVNYLTK